MIKIICSGCGHELKLSKKDKEGRPLYFDWYGFPEGGGPGLFSFDEDGNTFIALTEAGICLCQDCTVIIAQWGAKYCKENNCPDKPIFCGE